MNTPAPTPPRRPGAPRRQVLLTSFFAGLLASASLAGAQTRLAPGSTAVGDRTPAAGSAWATERQPELAAFSAWANRYVKTYGVAGASLPDAAALAQGAQLAQARRPVLAALMQTDPARAMAASVPASVRAKLPADVQSLLEAPFNVVGNYSAEGAAGGRSVTVEGHTYPAHVYGRQLDSASQGGINLRGFVLDGEAVLDASNPPARPIKVRASQTPVTATLYGNDAFSSAFQLFGTTGSVSDDNIGATKEAGEPNHAGTIGGASVWYAWTPTDSGAATFLTDDGAGGALDTVLAVYTGSAVNALTRVVSNDDANGGLNSQVDFFARAGVTYYIAVDGFNYGLGATVGSYTLFYFQQGNPLSPSITSDNVIEVEVSVPFTYAITATNGPTSFNATGLPSTLTLDSATGVITGTPTEIGNYLVLISATNSQGTGTSNVTLSISDHPVHLTFFRTEVPLPRSPGVYYLHLPRGGIFGFYAYLEDANYLYHFDMGYEYVFDANDGKGGVYFYDFTSSTFFYTSPTFSFPYLYDFSLNSVVYYYPDVSREGRYNTDGVRYFYNFRTGEIISK